MKTIATIAKNFFREVEYNPTILRIMDILDLQNLSKVGYSFGITIELYSNIIAIFKNQGYEVNTEKKKIVFFDNYEDETCISKCLIKSDVEYYILYSPNLKILAIRSTLGATNNRDKLGSKSENFLQENIFSKIPYTTNPRSVLKDFAISEGLSGVNFNKNNNILKEFGKAISFLNFKKIFETNLKPLDFERLMSTYVGFLVEGCDKNVLLTPYDEVFKTSPIFKNNVLKIESHIVFSEGLLITDNLELLGVYKAQLNNNEIILTTKLFSDSEKTLIN